MHQNMDMQKKITCPKRAILDILFVLDLFPHPFLCFPCLYDFFLLTFIEMEFLCQDPLTFAMREPLLPLPLQDPLHHDNGWCRVENRPCGDLKFHGHSYILSLM